MSAPTLDISEFNEWERNINDYYKKTDTQIKTILAESAEWVRERARMEMPVDTGFARARWGSEYPGVWRIEDDGFTIIQGAQLEPYEYIERLNEGWSKQAPAGFLDTVAQFGEYRLVDALEADIPQILEG